MRTNSIAIGNNSFQIENRKLNEADSDAFKQKMLQATETTGKDSDDKKLKEACQQLEAVFVQQMFKKMRETVPEDGLFGQDNGQKIFQDMLDDEYSNLAAKSGTVGLATKLYEQLSRSSSNIEKQKK